MSAPSLSITFAPSNPAPGATVTATYVVADAPADRVLTPQGGVLLDGVLLSCTGSLTLTHTYGYKAPTAAGLTFEPTADPRVWTAVVPAS